MAVRYVCIQPPNYDYTQDSDENSRYSAGYTSLSAMEVAENGSFSEDLVVEIIRGNASGSGSWGTEGADTTDVEFDGWACTAGAKVVITTLHGDEYTGASESWPDFANGYDTTAYRQETITGGAAGIEIDNDANSSNYLEIEFHGIQLKRTYAAANGHVVTVQTGAYHSQVTFNSCWLIHNSNASIKRAFNIIDNGSCDFYITNCVVELGPLGGGSAEGIYITSSNSGNSYIAHCTVQGFGADAIEPDNTGTDAVVYNTASFNNLDDIDGASEVEYCATDDGDDTGTNGIDWTSEATDWAANFTDYANSDYTIKDTDADIYLAGASLNTLATVDAILDDLCAEDITGYARPTGDSAVSIGAYEYQAAGGTTIECSTGTVTATGLAAGVSAGKTIACTTAAVTVTGLAASISAGTTIECSTGTVAAVGLQANVGAGKTVSCVLALVAATGLQASVGTGATIECSTATVAATGLQATLGTGTTIECSTATVTATGLQSNISAGTTIVCTTASVSVASLAATVQAGGSIQCTTATVVAVGLQASISASTTIECSTGTAAATGLTATVEDWTYINCTTPAIAVAGLAATLTIGKTISCTTGAIIATGITASIVDSDVPVGMVSVGITALKPRIGFTTKKPTITFTT